MDVKKLNKLFGHDVTRCSRCDTEYHFEEKPCVDYLSGYSYGDQLYYECPKCKLQGIFPWSGFLIRPIEEI